MKVAYFDCPFGAAGDMLCSSLVANGLEIERWIDELKKLNLPDGSFEISVEDVMRCAIHSKKTTVKCIQEHGHHHDHDHHDHHHHHEHDHHEHASRNGSNEGHGRSIGEINSLIEASSISEPAKKLSLAIFKNLAISESRVHDLPPDQVHFHEVGAIDAIVDIVGFSIAYHMLGIEQSVVSPLTLGCGTISTAHGVYPVPGPAVAYLVEKAGAPTTSLDIRYECLTPTGAAILTTIATRWGGPPAFQKIDSVGYGAGTLDPPTHPNVVRAYVGQCVELEQAPTQASLFPILYAETSDNGAYHLESQFRSEVIAVIEANVDDCPPNTIAYALEQALTEGALDISVVSATMKKGRSGHLITVLAKPEDRRKLEALLIRETSTLGVRSYFVERLVAQREFCQVKLHDASIRVKVGKDLNGNVVNVQPEYADCASIAQQQGLPLREVFEQALSQYVKQTE